MRFAGKISFAAIMTAQTAGIGLLRRKYVGAIIGSAAVLLVSNAAAEDELWSRGLMGTPSSGSLRPFNVVIIESVAGNHLLATCDYTNYSNEMGRARMIRIQGIQKGGKFHPRVFAKVANDVGGEWVQIAELGKIGQTASRKVAPNAVANDITVELDVFRPWIDKFIYGALVLPTGEKAIFDLKDLLSPEREAGSKTDAAFHSDSVRLSSSDSNSRNPDRQTVALLTSVTEPHLGSSIDDFRSVWGPPSEEESLVRTASLKWNGRAADGKSIAPGIFAAEVAFLDMRACEIVLRSRKKISRDYLYRLVNPFVKSFTGTKMPNPKSDFPNSSVYELSDHTFVLVNKLRGEGDVIVIMGACYSQNQDIFDREEAAVRPPTSNH